MQTNSFGRDIKQSVKAEVVYIETEHCDLKFRIKQKQRDQKRRTVEA